MFEYKKIIKGLENWDDLGKDKIFDNILEINVQAVEIFSF